MSTITPYKEQVIHLVAKYLDNLGYNQYGKQLRSDYILPIQFQKKNLMLKKGLINIIKYYVRNNDKMISYYTKRSQQFQQQQQQEQQQQIKYNNKHQKQQTKNWLRKFEKPKQLQQIIDRQQEQKYSKKQQNIHKKSNKILKKNIKIHKQIQSSSQLDQSYLQLEPKKNKKIKKVSKINQEIKKSYLKKDKQIKQNSKKIKNEEQKKQTLQNNKSKNHDSIKFFSRINVEDIGVIPENRKDNTFEAKYRFGQGGDQWGQYGYERLKNTRGDIFKKTKSKLKNKAFQSSGINIHQINSVPIL